MLEFIWNPEVRNPGLSGAEHHGYFPFPVAMRLAIARDMSSPDNAPAAPDWDAIARDPAFRILLADKIKFLVPATIFFVIYYFALPVLVGFYPEFMSREVFGSLNLAYLFALSQFFMAWILAGLYVVVARRWDRDSDAVLKKLGR